MFGAAAMSLSSVCVVGNALRLKLFRPKFQYGKINASKQGENKMKKDDICERDELCALSGSCRKGSCGRRRG